MANDIMRIDDQLPINDQTAVCSALPTGYYSRRVIIANYPVDLTITNVESKYADRFGNRTYYVCCEQEE
jgi:hypothetical protein